jgi:hypothetical protein
VRVELVLSGCKRLSASLKKGNYEDLSYINREKIVIISQTCSLTLAVFYFLRFTSINRDMDEF